MIIVFSLVLVILSVSVVSAADFNNTNEINSNIYDSLNSVDVQSLDNVHVGELQNASTATGTFDDLQVKINNAPVNSTLDLYMDYNGHYGSRVSVNKDLTIDGHGHTLNCLGEGGCSGFYSSSGTIILKNLRIINGHNDYTGKGGAIYAIGTAQYILDNCTLIGNWADDYGGAIYNEGKPLIIKNCNFNSNEVDDNDGGAIYSKSDVHVLNSTFDSNKAYVSGGAIYSEKNVYVDNCVFNRNSAYGALISDCCGGAICAGGDVLVNRCTFINNTAENYGGAIYSKKNVYINKDQDMDSYNSFFTNNTASKKDGGAVCAQEYVYAKNAEFHDNFAKRDSGAVYGGKVNVTHCYFLGNLAKGNGGAIGLVSNPTYVDNCIFTNNTACTSGGAIFSDTLTINNSTFDGNKAWTNGGGVYARHLTIKHTPSHFINNSAVHYSFTNKGGGAIFTSFFDDDVKYASFTGNSALSSGDGGAIYIDDKTDVTFSNCIFNYNKASDEGGAIYAQSRNAKISLTNNIFIGNTADEGYSVYNCGEFGTIKNNVWSNRPSKDNDELIEWEPLFIPNVHHVDSDPLRMGLVLNASSCLIGDTVRATVVFFKSDGSLFTGEIFDTNAISFYSDQDIDFKNRKSDMNTASVDIVPKVGGKYYISAYFYNYFHVGEHLDVYDLAVSAPEIKTLFNVPATFKVKLSGNKNLTSNQKVIITYRFNDYEAYTDENGEASFSLSNVATVGKFPITLKILDLTFDSAINVLSTINASDVVRSVGDQTPFYSRFIDNNGQYLPIYSTVGYLIDNSPIGYTQIIDKEGLAAFNIGFLSEGIHYIGLINFQTNELMAYQITINGLSQLESGFSQNFVHDTSLNVNSYGNSLSNDSNISSYDYSVNGVTNHSNNNSVAKSIGNSHSASGSNNDFLGLVLLILLITGCSGLIWKYKF